MSDSKETVDEFRTGIITNDDYEELEENSDLEDPDDNHESANSLKLELKAPLGNIKNIKIRVQDYVNFEFLTQMNLKII